MTTTVKNQYTSLVSIPHGMQATLIAAAASTGLIQRLSSEAIVESIGIAASQTLVFGEYLTDMNLKVSCLTGSLTYSVAQRTNDATSAETLIKVYVDPNESDDTGDGSELSPVKTIAKAFTLATATRNVIVLKQPCEYVEPASLTWPNVNGIRLICPVGDATISGPVTTPVLTISPTFTTTTFEAYLEGVHIKHTAQVGIEIDNANMTRKLLVGLNRVSSEQVSTGDSIHVTHTTAGQAIRIYAKHCDEFEGLVNVVAANNDDRFRFTDCVLIGGLTVAGAVTAEVLLHACVILTASGVTVATENVLTNVATVYRTDAGVYTQLVDAFSA